MAFGVVSSFGIGSLVARTVLAWVRSDPRAAELDRTNFHGRTVSLAGGPALAGAEPRAMGRLGAVGVLSRGHGAHPGS